MILFEINNLAFLVKIILVLCGFWRLLPIQHMFFGALPNFLEGMTSRGPVSGQLLMSKMCLSDVASGGESALIICYVSSLS